MPKETAITSRTWPAAVPAHSYISSRPDAPNATAREQGVFKTARGWLRGWDLTEGEQQRLAEMSDPEVVLQLRLHHVYIHVYIHMCGCIKT